MYRKKAVALSVCSVIVAFFFAACSGRDAVDTSLDALERAIVAAEQALTEQFGAGLSPEETTTARKKNIEARGRELQVTYAPVRDLDVATISRDQEKRRELLRERAVAAAADILNVQLAKTIHQ